MRRTGGSIALALAACGGGGETPAPDAGPRGELTIVGHSDLGARGMNAALAVAGDTVYVGSRNDAGDLLIVDVSDPASPSVVGSLPPVRGISSRELRVLPERNLLAVLDLRCSPDLHGCNGSPAEGDTLKLYDITDRHAPVQVGMYSTTSGIVNPRALHEMYLWQSADRVLAYLTTAPSSPEFEIVDITDPAAPALVVAWDPINDGGLDALRSDQSNLHSVAASDDGKTGYFSHLEGGLFLADLTQVIDGTVDPQIAMLTGTGMQADWSPPEPAGPHSAVPVPGRDVLVVTDEVYPEPFGAGCPWGSMRTVDISDPTAPTVVGTFRVAENADPCDGVFERTTFTSHNATVTHDVALVTWYSAGLQVVDISDPTTPTSLGEFRPDPIDSVTVEDPGIGGNPVLMWSYPVIQDGLIYVVDIRNGLYILRYTGDLEDEIAGVDFAEGNSNR